MSLEYSNVKTHIIDPINFQDKNRLEFRLDSDKMFLTGLRLVNWGYFRESGSDNNPNRRYGLLSLVKSIKLMDNNVLIDELNFPASYMGFKSLLTSNDKLASVEEVLLKNSSSLLYNLNTKRYERVVPDKNPANASNAYYFVDTTRAFIDLKMLLPFLDENNYLPTNIFKNLRLVIEFQSGTPFTTNTIKNVNVPQLIIDEITNVEGIKKIMPKMFSYMSIENERHNVPKATDASNNPILQNVSFRLKNFKNKFVNNVLVTKEQNDPSVSPAMNQEVIQIALNGKNMFPYEGIDRATQKLQLLNQSWGNISVPPNANEYLQNNTASNVLATLQGNNIANCDYTGFMLRDKVEDLQLNYSRLGNATNVYGGSDTPLLDSFTLNVYAQVSKAIIVDGNNYNVVYN